MSADLSLSYLCIHCVVSRKNVFGTFLTNQVFFFVSCFDRWIGIFLEDQTIVQSREQENMVK